MFKHILMLLLAATLVLSSCDTSKEFTKARPATISHASNFSLVSNMTTQLSKYPEHIEFYEFQYNYDLQGMVVPKNDSYYEEQEKFGMNLAKDKVTPRMLELKRRSRQLKYLRDVLDEVEVGHVYPEGIDIGNDLWVVKLLDDKEEFYRIQYFQIPKWKKS